MHSKSFIIHVYSTLFFLLLITGCKPAKESAIAVNNTQSIGTYYVDTFSAELSTVLIDSLPTSVSNQMLTGLYADPTGVGKFSAASYFQFSLAGIDKDQDGREDIIAATNTGYPTLDSAVLIITHTYSYGDTTHAQVTNICQLTQDMQTVSGTGYIYNGQSFAYDPTPLATFNPKYTATNYNTTLRIRMDALGNEFLQMAYNKDNRVATNDAFKTFFKGMTLMPGTGNTCIYGYAYTPTLQLYYHDSNTPDIGQSYTFKHTPNVDLFYNRLKNDRSGTNLSPLKFAYQEIPATQTNNESYVMTGVELMSKIKFPYLNMIHSTYPNFAINRAILEIHPKPLTYNLFFKLPTDLVLYQTNYTNVPGTVISYQGTSIPQIASPHVDYESNLSTYYQFNITDFVTNQLKVNYFDEAALILTSPRSLSGNRTERLVLDNKYSSYTIILKLYVTLF